MDHPFKPSGGTSPPTTELTLTNLAPKSKRLYGPESMAIGVVEFSREGYKIRKFFA